MATRRTSLGPGLGVIRGLHVTGGPSAANPVSRQLSATGEVLRRTYLARTVENPSLKTDPIVKPKWS